MAEFTRRVGLGRPLTYQEADDNFEFVEEQADAAEQSASDAEDAKIAAELVRDETETARDAAILEVGLIRDDAVLQTETARDAAILEVGLIRDDAVLQTGLIRDETGLIRDEAADSEDQAGIYAAAAQAAAGIPTLAGNAKKVLSVKMDESGVEWGDRVDYPPEGIPVSEGDGWGDSKVAPTGEIVGTSDTQTLTGKTFGSSTAESVLATGTGIVIDEAAVPWRQITLTANTIATINLPVGVSRSLWVNPATFTVTWPGALVWRDGETPSLPANKWSLITFTGRPDSAVGFGAVIWSAP